jgi:hypothetical protein
LKYILDIKISIAKMKNNKALRDGEVTGDIVRVIGSVGMQWLYRIIRNICQSKEMPDDLRNGMILSICKKGHRNCDVISNE